MTNINSWKRSGGLAKNMTDADSKDIRMSPEYLDILKGQMETRHVSSAFGFLNAHNGLRKGKLHVMMGSSHSGKSTLLRTLVFDALNNNPDKKLMVFLSEETTDDFIREIAVSKYRDKKGLDRLIVHSSFDRKKPTTLKEMVFLIKEVNPDIFFFDNITTAAFYEEASVKNQGQMVYILKDLAKELNIPFYIVVHTGATVTDNMRRLVEMNDIRGSKQIVNMAEFFYIAQTFHTESYDGLLRKKIPQIRPMIFIKKHRGQDCESRIFYLNYDKEKRIYSSDREMEFSEVKHYFKERNYL